MLLKQSAFSSRVYGSELGHVTRTCMQLVDLADLQAILYRNVSRNSDALEHGLVFTNSNDLGMFSNGLADPSLHRNRHGTLSPSLGR